MSEGFPAAEAGAGDDFLSGEAGMVFGIRAGGRALVADAACDAASLARLLPWRLARAARPGPRRRVLAACVEREGMPSLVASARGELARSRHQVTFATRTAGALGKFENLNALLDEHPPQGHDWLLLIDDDVALPPHFLDVFVFLAERFDLRLAQPAHRHRSHAAFPVTRRRPLSVARETGFVEIGPLCALRAETFPALLPFPALRAGWGLDAHWAALAREHGWRMGVIDATPIRHGLRRIASSYSHGAAVEEGRAFLAGRPYVPAAEAARTLTVHYGWR